MILHTIIKYRPQPPPQTKKLTKPPKPGKFQGVNGSVEHRKFLLDRAVEQCPYKVGTLVTHKRKTWAVNGIYGSDYYEFIEWKGLAPKSLELVDPADNTNYLWVNMGNVRKKR